MASWVRLCVSLFVPVLLGACAATPIVAGRPGPKAALAGDSPPLARARHVESSAIAPASHVESPADASPLERAARADARDRKPVTIRVAPDGEVSTIAQAAMVAKDGDTVEVQAGDYRGDVAVWPQKRLTIRAVGGRARLIADGKAAAGKGIWVIPNGEFLIEGFDFEGARVPHRNGAGIRFEAGKLTVRNARFIGNEMGILTGNRKDSELVVEGCLFSDNGREDGHNHNLYVGQIGRLVVRGNYLRSAMIGHLLKSRARVSEVTYNRLTDEKTGRASYELEFPNGGQVIAIGNLIEQGKGTENNTIVSYGAEGYIWPENRFGFVHNTVVNRRSAGGVFVRATSGDARALLANNVFAGKGELRLAIPATEIGNVSIGLGSLADPESYDYRLTRDVRLAPRAASIDVDGWPAYRLLHRYVHPMRVEKLEKPASAPGAVQP